MARKDKDELLMEDELAAAFLKDEEDPALVDPEEGKEIYDDTEMLPQETPAPAEPKPETDDDEWDNAEDFPGQLAVDVYETADKLVVKARTAGISKSDLNVTIADNILTISGVLSGGEDEHTTCWHIQECYWGEFSRTIALPVQVKEDENSVKAELKDGVLTITFEKEKVEAPIKISIQ